MTSASIRVIAARSSARSVLWLKMMKLPIRKPRRFDLSKALFILPNLFTVSSIFCGFYGAVLAASASGPHMDERLYRACIAVLFAMVFDAVDGRVARLTRTQSEFGVQMDSLADVISFGVVPALIAWHWGLENLGSTGLFACFVYCACGAIRLARFNVMAAADNGPSAFFLGLPIPAAAGFLVAVILATIGENRAIVKIDRLTLPLAIDPRTILLYLLGFFMVSNIKFRTFKATRLTARAISVIILVVGCAVGLAMQLSPALSIVALMGSYLLLGIFEAVFRREKLDAAAYGDDVEGEESGEDDEEELID